MCLTMEVKVADGCVCVCVSESIWSANEKHKKSGITWKIYSTQFVAIYRGIVAIYRGMLERCCLLQTHLIASVRKSGTGKSRLIFSFKAVY